MRITTEPESSRIDAALLIPGRGDPIPDATLIFRGKTITWVGCTHALPTRYADLRAIAQVQVLMPGLWDCHVHFWGTTTYSMDEMARTEAAVLGLRLARDAVATLNAGYTSVREMSGFGTCVAQVVDGDLGWLPGPRVYSAVSILSPTAGHGDARGLPLREYWDSIAHALPAYVCDGEAECLKAVRVQVRRGAEVIKVATSGGICSSGDDIMAQSFSDAELKAIVDEATRNRLVVAAHCIGPEGIKAAVRAGCRTIEHATFLDTDPEALQMMVDADVIFVATRATIEMSLRHPDSWTPEQLDQLRESKQHHAESYRQAVAAGVRIALGTDIAVSTHRFPWNHGMNGIELGYAVEAGLTPLQAIEAATATAPETIGPKAPQSGQLREGYDADFIALDKNPLEDISILSDARNVLHVWRAGKQWKFDGRPIGFLGQ